MPRLSRSSSSRVLSEGSAMKKGEILKSIALNYLIIVAESTLSVAVIGSIFAGDIAINYRYFFIPIALGVFYMLPCLPIYFMENMTIKQVMIQRIAELIVIEAATIFAAYLLIGEKLGVGGYIAVGASVLIFDVATYVLQWIFEKNEADKINKIISDMRNKSK